MGNQFSYYSKLSIAEAPVGFEQSLVFSYREEKIMENGKVSVFGIDREAEIVYRGVWEGCPRYQIFLYKTEIFLERRSVPSKVLIEALSYVLDELVVTTDFLGRIGWIGNYPFLKYRWAKIRAELISEYNTEEYLHYFLFLDEKINDLDLLIAYLNMPEMYGLYFNGLRRRYEFEEVQKNEFKFYIDNEIHVVEESVQGHLQESGDRKLVTLDVVGSDEAKNIKLLGEYVFLDGIMDTAKKEIDFNETKIKYSTRWVGLKNYFQ